MARCLRCLFGLSVVFLLAMLAACERRLSVHREPGGPADGPIQAAAQKGETMADKVVKADEEWRQLLTPEQYRVTRQKGTEPPFSGAYYDLKKEGVYRCVCCGNELFGSETKFDSGTGWPSFWAAVSEGKISTETDRRLLTTRTEVLCERCGAHLGHVFDDGPRPTGLRYCINSVALEFVETSEDEER